MSGEICQTKYTVPIQAPITAICRLNFLNWETKPTRIAAKEKERCNWTKKPKPENRNKATEQTIMDKAKTTVPRNRSFEKADTLPTISVESLTLWSIEPTFIDKESTVEGKTKEKKAEIDKMTINDHKG